MPIEWLIDSLQQSIRIWQIMTFGFSTSRNLILIGCDLWKICVLAVPTCSTSPCSFRFTKCASMGSGFARFRFYVSDDVANDDECFAHLLSRWRSILATSLRNNAWNGPHRRMMFAYFKREVNSWLSYYCMQKVLQMPTQRRNSNYEKSRIISRKGNAPR